MKKYQYIVAAACLLIGGLGFVNIYTSNQEQERQEELAKSQQQVEQSQNIDVEELNDSQIAKTKVEDTELEIEVKEEVEKEEQVAEVEMEEDKEDVEDEVEEAPVATVTEEAIHFNPDNGLVWPIEGSVLLDYSMDSTIYFPTLQQYQYNPAMVLSASVNDKVYFIAKGKITNIETNEVTGLTVTQDIGDGYTAIYGQLKELNFEEGEIVQSGQVVGYVNEATKYYAVEGSNVYFQLLKDGVPVDPEEILP